MLIRTGLNFNPGHSDLQHLIALLCCKKLPVGSLMLLLEDQASVQLLDRFYIKTLWGGGVKKNPQTFCFFCFQISQF